MLETAIKTLFDFQRFEKNVPLQNVIDEVQIRYATNRPLILSDGFLAAAAGGVRFTEENSQEPDHDGSELL